MDLGGLGEADRQSTSQVAALALAPSLPQVFQQWELPLC